MVSVKEAVDEEERERLKRWYTYLYKDIDWKHAISIKKTLLKNGQITPEAEQFVKIVNWVKKSQGLLHGESKFIE